MHQSSRDVLAHAPGPGVHTAIAGLVFTLLYFASMLRCSDQQLLCFEGECSAIVTSCTYQECSMRGPAYSCCHTACITHHAGCQQQLEPSAALMHLAGCSVLSLRVRRSRESTLKLWYAGVQADLICKTRYAVCSVCMYIYVLGLTVVQSCGSCRESAAQYCSTRKRCCACVRACVVFGLLCSVASAAELALASPHVYATASCTA